MSKAKNLGAGTSFAQARPISARRAAIGAATGAPTEGVPEPTELPIALISQNPDNPRAELRALEGLADSIREIGLVNSITVATVDAYLAERPERADDLDEGARYLVIDGHRRLEAARLAGVRSIRVSVNDRLVATDEALLEAAFVANVHRDDMDPIEQAQALRRLVEFYGSQNKAAKRLGIGQSTISSKLSVLDLDPALQADLVEGRRKLEHVRNLSKLTPEEQHRKADARAEAAQQRSAAQRDLSRRDNPKPTADLSRRDNPKPTADLSRRDNPEPTTDLSRRDNPEPTADLSRRDNPEPTADLSRRDNPEPTADLSRRDNPGAVGEDLPGQRSAPGDPAESVRLAPGESAMVALPEFAKVTKMPWHDGDAVADLVLCKMTPEQQKTLFARLLAAHVAREEPPA